MSRRPWLSLGFLVPLLAALSMIVAVACGGEDATATHAPAAEEPTAEATVEVTATAVPTPEPTAAATEAPQTPEEPVAGPHGTLRTSFESMPVYHPHPRYRATGFEEPTMVAHEGLFILDRDYQLTGNLVKDWSVAADNKTWTFELHDGIQFHGDWGPLTPEDVIYSTRELGADDGTCGCSQIQTLFGNPDEDWRTDGFWEVINDTTIQLNSDPSGLVDLPYRLDFPSSNSGWIVSKDQWESLLDSGSSLDEALPQVVGTGPWELEELKLGEVWRFKAVEGHWRQTPYFAELHLLTIPEEATALANFEVGRIDTWSAAPDSLAKVAELETTKFMSLTDVGEMILYFWQNGYTYFGTDKEWPGYNPDLPWVSDDPEVGSAGWERARKVREAMGLAIDRQKLVDELLHGNGAPGALYGWQPLRSLWPDDWNWDYNPDRARELLAEAGYADGFDITLSSATSRLVEVTRQACEAIAGMLQDVGINAQYRDVPLGDLYDGYKARTQQGITCQHINAFGGEPVSLHRISYDPELLWGVGWDHPWFTAKMKEAYETPDADARWALQFEMGDWLRDNALAMAVYSLDQIFPLGPQVDPWSEHLSMGEAQSISGLEYAPHRQ